MHVILCILNIFQKENKNAVTEVDLGCKDHNNDHKYRVYVATYLGMGANEGFDKYVNWLVNESGVTNENRYEISCLKY